jgi:ketosteroid isomerase-like protein
MGEVRLSVEEQGDHMTTHPNHTRVQEAWDAIDQGDLSPIGAMITPDVAMVHGPGAGPFAGPSEGIDRLLEMSLFFAEVFAGSFHQKGRCIYADDHWAIASVHETGTTPDGARFDNRALWIERFTPEGMVDRIWTVDLDDSEMLSFWANNARTSASVH